MEFKNFLYKSSELYCENVSIREVAEKVGTPFYIYSRNYILDAYREAEEAFAEVKHRIFYAIKSCSNLSIIKMLKELGASFDCNSGGELFRALKAGVDPYNILFTGVGKTEEEINMGLDAGIYLFQVESQQEIELLNELAGKKNKKARISIRVNPNVNPKTHKYISTGLNENKFGIDHELAEEIFIYAASLPNIELAGIDMHIGSQITYVSVFKEAVRILLKMKRNIEAKGIKLDHIDIGGGFGIPYDEETVPSIKEFAKEIVPVLRQCTGCTIFLEPGRYISGNSAALITKVLYSKEHRGKFFLITDAAMTELIRPALYEAYHHILHVEDKQEKEDFVYDVVGPVCETGDFFASNRGMRETERGELLAIMSAGAYGYSMSSNYNSRRRVPEILVDGDKYFIIRERETFEDLVKHERII